MNSVYGIFKKVSEKMQQILFELSHLKFSAMMSLGQLQMSFSFVLGLKIHSIPLLPEA